MKHHHDFQAERLVANHCEDLMARVAPRFDRTQAAQSLFDRLSADLCERLRAHLLGQRPLIDGDDGTSQTGDALMRSIGAKAANYAVHSSASAPDLLVSFAFHDATRLTDRLFGGDGTTSENEAETLALSTTLALQRIVQATAASFCKAADIAECEATISHDTDIARIAPFERAQYSFAWKISIAQGELGPWTMTLALAESDLDALLQGPNARSAPESDPSVFGEIPLSVSASLAEMRLPLERLASLRAGDMLSFSPARRIPLLIDGTRFADGQVGTLDDRVALQISEIFSRRSNP